MIFGTIVLEDTTLTFRQLEGKESKGEIVYTVVDGLTGKNETKTVDGPSFLKALAIAVHNDGEPDYREDYPAAESVQPEDKDLRWIP